MSLAKNLGGGDKENSKGWERSIFFMLLICENPERSQKIHRGYTLSHHPPPPNPLNSWMIVLWISAKSAESCSNKSCYARS